MSVLEMILGLALIFTALHDMFHTLFHPSGRGAMAESISFRIWRLFRKAFAARHAKLSLAGPVAFVATVAAWLVLITIGFAFIYHPFLRCQFVMSPGLNIADHTAFFDALNISLGSLITVGGDFQTNSRWLRLAMGVEAVLGFALLTTSLSWVLSIYPVLEYRRSAAHRLSLLHYANRFERVGLSAIPDRETEQLVIGIASDMTKIRNDLAQFPITYYFHEHEPQSAFPGALSLALDIANRAMREDSSEQVRLAGIVLQGAIHDFLHLVGSWFLRTEDEREDKKLMAAYAADHFREELHSD